jgi:C4-dicarboxylate-specific signal transduction histidine kinase
MPGGSFHTEEKPITKSEIELRDCIMDAPPSTWLVLPLIHNSVQFGFLLLQAETEFLLYYGELVRHVSAALHGARMYTALSNAHEALRKSQRELIEASRLAGIAEIATGILHNIGNAMNSVTTSASLALDQLRKSRVNGVVKVSELLHENRDRLPDFFANDPRGPQVVDYLNTLSGLLERERAEMVKEVDSLRSGIEHINNIVAAQQSYVGAAVSGLTEVVAPAELMENALRLNEASLTRHNIAVVLEFAVAPPIKVQRQKALQILVNLIRNAKDSLDQAGCAQKQLILRTRPTTENMVQLEVSDNGLGIDQEGLTKIFGFGFTTKKNGHGFGLHSSALAAKEMGGSLRVESAGVGKGATFILAIPSATDAD